MTATTIDQMMSQEVQWIDATDTLHDAKRLLGNSTLRSVIVVEGDRAVGMITWPMVRELPEGSLDQPVSSQMMTDFPRLHPGQSLTEAQQVMGHDINIDELPVLSDSGELIGAVPRQALVHSSTPVSESPGVAGAGTDPVTAPIEHGMSVRDSTGSRLGSVTEADYRADGGVETFTVEHGMIFKKHKRLPGDMISEIEGDEVRLRMDGTEFGLIQNIEDAGA